MKRFFTVALLAFATLLAGCAQVDESVDYVDGGKTLIVSIPASRTALGDKSGDQYPLYWSADDKIVANGEASAEIKIDETNNALATFEFNSVINYPCNITYPYSATSNCTATNPTVVFDSEQSYVEGTFESGSAPMCGYVAKWGMRASLSPLAGAACFSVKVMEEGTTLKSISIIGKDGVALAGEYDVNCSTAKATPRDGAVSVVNYTIGEDVALSTTTEKLFFISLPAGNFGDCKVEFVDTAGGKMRMSWTNASITAGVVREFKSVTYKAGTVITLDPLVAEEDELNIVYPTVYGNVTYTDGTPAVGVAVSDGFSVVTTDENGYYTIDVSKDCWYIYLSLPSDCKIGITENGGPDFYKAYPSNTPRYDFKLEKLPNGKEEEFLLYTFGDPQVPSTSSLNRMLREAVPHIKQNVASQTLPCYGITLGDIVSSGNSRDSTPFMPKMRDAFSYSSVGLPVFQVMGNHDCNYFYKTIPLAADDRSSTPQIQAQRVFESVFGPINYSFNRGDVHIIGMRDIVYNTTTDQSNYTKGFTKEQFEWLKQDLAVVPKSKMVVLCMHIPFFNSNVNYVQETLNLLDQYAEAHIMSAHTHYQYNYNHKHKGTSHRVFEHNAATVCGAWWVSNLNKDGVPNGYGIFKAKGNSFVGWYHQGYSEGMDDPNFQFRLHRGGDITGAKISGSNSNGTKGYYQFPYDDSVIYANVFLGDEDWTLKVYENGTYTGDMTYLLKYATTPSFSASVGSFTYADPKRPGSGVESGRDYWSIGFHLGVLGLNEDRYSANYHMFKYTLKNKSATVKVVAIDSFGKKYESSTFISPTDYTTAKKP